MIPYSKQSIANDDIKSVVKVLKSKILTQGKEVVKFEKKIANFVGSKYSVAVSSASAALHLSCLALELKKDQILWTVPNTFIASASCALHCQAKVDFVDIDDATSNISIEKLKIKLISAKKKNSLPNIIVPVHFAGQPTNQKEIYKLSKKYNFKIIEDASHSLGALHYKERVGSCKWSNLTVFSFHPVKPITTAEGGIITTNNKKYYEKLIKLRNHGISRNYNQLKIKSNWYYEQQLLGFNYRMNEIQAALGISQLKKIKKFNTCRNKVANFYFKQLKYLPINLPLIEKENYCSFHLFVIKVDRGVIKKSYDTIYKDLIAKGLGVNLHYLPVHLHPVFKKLGFKKGDFPVSEKHASSAFSIPVFYNLKDQEQKKIVKILKQTFSKRNG
jgi:UDP-4-amino-4,6-dideoxy-N-acetyl-beta-L-altrosamine transaminase